MTTRLTNIVIRHRNSRIRDAVFACVVALATLLGASAIGIAVSASASAGSVVPPSAGAGLVSR